jgi:PAS domain S-box-containing protein
MDQIQKYTNEIAELKNVFGKMVVDVQECSVILLDLNGTILTWNKGAENIKGYTPEEIIGQHISIFYLPEDRNLKLAEKLMEEAKAHGSAVHTGKRIKKNGTIFWGRIELTAIKNDAGNVIGFTKMATPIDIQER